MFLSKTGSGKDHSTRGPKKWKVFGELLNRVDSFDLNGITVDLRDKLSTYRHSEMLRLTVK